MSELRRPTLGAVLVVLGVIGVVTGLVPLVTCLVQTLVDPNFLATCDILSHGDAAMGLAVEWAMLSSAMGVFLGAMMVWSGTAWRRGRSEARLVTWFYVWCGVAVNATDMCIFIFRAKAGPMRAAMLGFDGIALAIPVALGLWLAAGRSRAG